MEEREEGEERGAEGAGERLVGEKVRAREGRVRREAEDVAGQGRVAEKPRRAEREDEEEVVDKTTRYILSSSLTI